MGFCLEASLSVVDITRWQISKQMSTEATEALPLRPILVLGSTSQDFSITSKMGAKNYPWREKRRLTKPWLTLVIGLLEVPSLWRVIPQPAIRDLNSQLPACARLLFVSTY